MVVAILGHFLSIILATVGIYGVTSYLVSRRTNEIGLRIALGASPSEVLRMVVRGGVGVALAGVAVGCWSTEDVRKERKEDVFAPERESSSLLEAFQRWEEAVQLVRDFG